MGNYNELKSANSPAPEKKQTSGGYRELSDSSNQFSLNIESDVSAKDHLDYTNQVF